MEHQKSPMARGCSSFNTLLPAHQNQLAMTRHFQQVRQPCILTYTFINGVYETLNEIMPDVQHSQFLKLIRTYIQSA